MILTSVVSTSCLLVPINEIHKAFENKDDAFSIEKFNLLKYK